MMLAGLAGAGQVSAASTNMSTYQATTQAKEARKKGSIFGIGSIPGMGSMSGGQFGLTPKEYGMRFGTGASRKGKSNRLRYATNAKLKRRGVC